jgi:two-component system response regulator (stage 0 sporulation protein F)
MKRILVVDDEEGIRQLYKEELEDEGYEVELAERGEEALEKISRAKPDAVILDLKMPGMGGLDVLEWIREQDKDLPVIISTAYGEYKSDLTTWASDAYIVKSADLTELKRVIRGFLDQ